MARRKLTLQQRRRIVDRQAARLGKPAPDTSRTDAHHDVGNLGPEQPGIIVARYGRQADIVPVSVPEAVPRRCNVRANLEDLVTGDRVIWRDGEPTGVIEAIEARHCLLSRPDARGNLRPVAANIDRIAIVVAPEPAPHANLIDRYLVAARSQDIVPFIILNKVDLPAATDPELLQMLTEYDALGYDLFRVSSRSAVSLEPLQARLAAFTSVLVGQSGVGKSSLINALVPQADASVQALSGAVTKGRHTTSTATLFQIPGGGRLIDSPGIREFGLWHLDPERVAEGFVEFLPHLGHCRFRDCRHLDDEPGCAIQEAVCCKKISSRRLASYRQIVNGLTVG